MTARTPAQRKAAERQRRRERGEEEVRGIYAPRSRHSEVREAVRVLLSSPEHPVEPRSIDDLLVSESRRA